MGWNHGQALEPLVLSKETKLIVRGTSHLSLMEGRSEVSHQKRARPKERSRE